MQQRTSYLPATRAGTAPGRRPGPNGDKPVGRGAPDTSGN